VLSVQSLPRVNAHGFGLHAAVRWRADQRTVLEQLCRYIILPTALRALRHQKRETKAGVGAVVRDGR